MYASSQCVIQVSGCHDNRCCYLMQFSTSCTVDDTDNSVVVEQ